MHENDYFILGSSALTEVGWLYRRERLLQAEKLATSSNVHLLRGVVELGKLVSTVTGDVSSACMTATDVWHTYACVAYNLVKATLFILLTAQYNCSSYASVSVLLC